MTKEYENRIPQVLRDLEYKGCIIDRDNRTINVKNATLALGNTSWGKIDFLTSRQVGYHLTRF